MRSVQRALVVAAAATLAAVALTATPAQAAPARLTPAGAATLLQTLGNTHTSGSYIDANGVTVVNVTDAKSAVAARAAGATVRMVTRSTAYLDSLRARLDAGTVGTAWSVDPVSNQLVIEADSSVSTSAFAHLGALAAGSAGAARAVRVAGQFHLDISGGDAIYGGQFRCSLGFNVRSGSGTFYFLTAGHCGNIASTWYANSSHTTVLGNTAGSSFPGNDYAIVRYTNSSISHPGTVGSQDITSSRNPSVGETVTRRGSTTGIHTGTVTALNATVHYAEGTVTGLIQTTVCAEGGDSGGPLYHGTAALGLTSGGSGNCSSGGTTFFQPVVEALNVFGVQVY